MNPQSRAGLLAQSRTARILGIVVFNAIVYFTIGLPLAVFPGLVRYQLGFGAALAGGLISLQYAATLATRSLVGRFCDTRGAKFVVSAGQGFAFLSGFCVVAAGLCHSPAAVLGWLTASRLALGAAESGAGTGCIAWGVGRVGATHTAEVISWNGVASYGGVALGAPVGVALFHAGGLAAMGITVLALTALGFVGTRMSPAVPVLAGARLGLGRVARAMLPFGLALAGGSIGFGAIVAFIALDYSAHHWPGAAYALTVFGLAFIAVRLVAIGSIGRFGGFRASLVSFTIEAAGLLLLWAAAAPHAALCGAALTGVGFSLIFPAIAVEALKTVPASSRGAAVGLYTVFLDLALGLTGPGAGLIADHFGYPAVFLASAAAVLAALLLTWQLMVTHKSKNWN
ncbi:MFS transporter [Acidocella sp.]|uniref:MFS transporter n=1 Tax=Acidocella sp. TaxID=50710 RepID=UPI00260E5F4A|nr:MFS transporter [Acidocella sp.]